MKNNFVAAMLALASMATCNAIAGQDKWDYTFGTGLFALNIDGDIGFDTALGPVMVDASMNFSEVRDLLETAYGFGGSASRGDWTILYKYNHMKLEGTESGSLPSSVPATVRIQFEFDGGEVAGIYRFAENNGHHWGALGGLRYIKQDLDLRVSTASDSVSTSRGDDWTDVLVGITHSKPLSSTLVWNNRFDIGFGGSDGTYHVNTGLAWKFAQSWSAIFFGDYTKHDYENSSPGSPSWYVYDAAEFGWGANVMYHF